MGMVAKPAPRLERSCETCGQVFSDYHYNIVTRNKRFCSNTCAQAPRRIERPDKDELEQKYKSGMSTTQIAAEFGVSKGTIYNWFRHHGIPTRTIGEAVSISNIERGKWQGKDHPTFTHPGATPGRGRSRAGKRAVLGGLFVRSSWENNWALVLNFRKDLGQILEWEYEPESFEFPVKRGNRHYTPDFKVTLPNGEVEYHEVKGYMDQNSKVKLKRFAKYYPHLHLRLIDAKTYREVAKDFKTLPGWELPTDPWPPK